MREGIRSRDPVRMEGIHASFSFWRPAEGVVLVVITGPDAGELGDAPFHELDRDLGSASKPELFIDARSTVGATVDVSRTWAAWLARNRDRYARLHMLTGSRYVTITAEFVRRFAALGEQMRVYSAPVAFEEALREACQGQAEA